MLEGPAAAWRPSYSVIEEPMQTQTVEYQADGLQMLGHLAYDPAQSGRRPGVVVVPEVFGLGGHAKSRAERLAGLGYVALAADMHGQQHIAGSLNEALEMVAELRASPAKMRARTDGALQALLARPDVDPNRIAVIGYCLGGTLALELARGGADVKAVVGFHSGLATSQPEDAKNIKGKVLVCIGADDPGVDASQRAAFEAEMRAGKVNWQMSLYGGVKHSFTNPEAHKVGLPDFAAYDAQADARSWNEMIALFNEVFGK
jgi:dienelactone hydrolase